MTKKQFYLNEGEVGILKILDMRDDKENIYLTSSKSDMGMVVEHLNELNDENERLKSEYKVLHTQYQDLKKFVENNFDEYLTQEKLNIQIIKLSDENEQLKQQLDYIQNLISEQIEHQKIESGQKAHIKQLQKVIEDYNEWVLGHKR